MEIGGPWRWVVSIGERPDGPYEPAVKCVSDAEVNALVIRLFKMVPPVFCRVDPPALAPCSKEAASCK